MKKTVCVLLFAFLLLAGCAPGKSEGNAIQITLEIQGNDTNIFGPETVEALDTDTVFVILKKICEQNDIPIAYSGTGSTVYVTQIAGLKEKQLGPMAGWLYEVNSEQPSKGMGKYTLSNEDSVVIFYSVSP